MNQHLSWDTSLIKKFSSFNHYKLLNQLRSEVKKYPLNNKKTTSKIIGTNKNDEISTSSNSSKSQEYSVKNNSNINNESFTNQPKVSFNNSKNFSIYNKVKNQTINQPKDDSIPDVKKIIEDSVSSTFKDRLNQIDMK